MTQEGPFSAILFDAYGTIFDLSALADVADALSPGNGKALATAWRQKQIEYALLRTLSDRYADFRKVTHDALEYTLAAFRLEARADVIRETVNGFVRLPLHPEAADALRLLKVSGERLAILSNGTAEMLAEGLAAAGIDDLFDHVISVDEVGRFKTAAQAYQLGPDVLGVPLDEILFVSSNGWDAAGATWFGYPAFWVNRYALPAERLDAQPSATGQSLDDVVDYVIPLRSRAD